MTSIWAITFLIGALVGTLAMLGVVCLWRYRERTRGRRSPLSGQLLRGPGQSLRDRIEDLRWDVAMYFSAGGLPIPLAYGLYLSEWVSKGRAPGTFAVAVFTLFAIGAVAWFGSRLWTTLRELRKLRLGYDAELAVGQELNQLMRHGWRVFHDFPVPGRKFNIDHVVVGPGGVFAVETKGRSKPKPAKAVRQAGKSLTTALQFPDWAEKKPMQAEAVGDWLRDWLKSAVGEYVTVQTVIVLPGWYVKRTGSKGVPVLAIRQVSSYFTGCEVKLDEKLAQRIAHQLEQRCRDVLPAAYRTEREAAAQAA